MEKKKYTSPAMVVVIFSKKDFICGSGSQLKSVESNAGLEYKGGSDGEAMSRQSSVWDEDE